MVKQANLVATLSPAAQKVIYLDVCQRPEIEACGVLLGSRDEAGNWQIEQAHPLRNMFNSPVYFEFYPEDLLTMELTYPDKVVGVYHSHPTGFPHASKTDRDNMQRVNREQHIPWLWLIISGPFDSTFRQRAQEHLPEESMIAYHHFEQEGLQKISIQRG